MKGLKRVKAGNRIEKKIKNIYLTQRSQGPQRIKGSQGPQRKEKE